MASRFLRLDSHILGVCFMEFSRRSVLAGIGAVACTAGQAHKAHGRSEVSPSEWMDKAMGGTKPVTGTLALHRFKDPTYLLLKPIKWMPHKNENTTLPTVTVPKGFVTDFASIPQLFWSALRPDGEYAYAAVIHDYLYWYPKTTRQNADLIFLLAMKEFGVSSWVANPIHQAVRRFGRGPWRNARQSIESGEKRILKKFPQDPKITWEDWKNRPGVFE